MSFVNFLSRARVVAIPAGALIATALAFSATAQENQIAQTPNAPPPPAMHPGMRPEMMQGPHEGDRCARLAEHLDRINKNLTPEQVRDVVAGHLVQSGLTTLKTGKVRTTSDGTVAVDITTTSGSLVATREISPKTGLPADLVKRCQAIETRMDAAHAGKPGEDDHDGHDGHGPMGHPWMGRGHFGGPMGDGMMGGGMMGGGMMGEMGGMHHGAGGLALISNVGPGRDLNLNTDQARKLADAELVRLGNSRLKVGKVKEKDADTIAVDIVTSDNALVLHEEIDRHNGHIKRAS